MREELRETAHELRSAARATLLAVRSMIDARVRRIESREADRGLRVVDSRTTEGAAPHEIV